MDRIIPTAAQQQQLAAQGVIVPHLTNAVQTPVDSRRPSNASSQSASLATLQQLSGTSGFPISQAVPTSFVPIQGMTAVAPTAMLEAAPHQAMDITVASETMLDGYGMQRAIFQQTSSNTALYQHEIHALNTRLAQVESTANNELASYERENQRICTLARTELDSQKQ